MSLSLAITLIVVFDAAIVLAIVGLLGYAIRTQWRDFGHEANRRRSADRRRRPAAAVPVRVERRRTERRRGEPVIA